MRKYIIIAICLLFVGLVFAQIPHLKIPLSPEQRRLRQRYVNRNLIKKQQKEKRQSELKYLNTLFNGGNYTNADAVIALGFRRQNQRMATIENKIKLLNQRITTIENKIKLLNENLQTQSEEIELKQNK